MWNTLLDILGGATAPESLTNQNSTQKFIVIFLIVAITALFLIFTTYIIKNTNKKTTKLTRCNMSNEKLVCPICGEPTRVYMGNARKDHLCGKHADMLKSGELVLNDKGLYVKTQSENAISDLTCIICGEPSNGKHFCYDCYNKYKDRSIDIRVSNCRDTQVIDEYGNKTKKTKDGRNVRSLSEKIIIDYFFDNFIRVVYEKTIPYVNEKGEDATLHPDFYLPDYNLYIEFNGLTNKSYLKKKNYANKIYEEKGYNVVILESQDIDDIEGSLTRILSKYKK